MDYFPKEFTHECSNRPRDVKIKVIPLYKSWCLVSGNQYIKNIKYCPYCNKSLCELHNINYLKEKIQAEINHITDIDYNWKSIEIIIDFPYSNEELKNEISFLKKNGFKVRHVLSKECEMKKIIIERHKAELV